MVATFRTKNKSLVQSAVDTLKAEKPMTLRQLYYRLVSAGVLTNNQSEYKRLGQVMTRLREHGEVPRTWIVDHVRSTLKPSSWTGLGDYGETVREVYRKDFWASMDNHVEVFVEKDAIAGTIQPVTREYDVSLHVCRGYSSVSFAGEIAELWAQIDKPIFAYYLGDFDPSGFDIERDLRAKLARYSGLADACAHPGGITGYFLEKDRASSGFYWERLGVLERDFDRFDLVRLPVKTKDKRSGAFMDDYGEDCAEVDALAPSELRSRVKAAIEFHIDQERWARLQETERLEQETLVKLVKGWQGKST